MQLMIVSLQEGLADEAPRPKRRKPTGADKRLVAPIPLDSCGRPLFPIVLPGCKVHSLGEIVTDRAGFHCQESLYPVGYCSSRIYASVLNANHACIYTCTILDAGTGPRFEIVAEDAPERPFVGSSPDECYVALLRAVNRTCGAEVIVPAARGADFFALPHPTIQNLVQSCPGARKCPNYRWVRFESPACLQVCTSSRSHWTLYRHIESRWNSVFMGWKGFFNPVHGHDHQHMLSSWSQLQELHLVKAQSKNS
ncbi:hypothetical protein V5799_018446 [Amblyomma americanum]|uniref:Transforming growth factor beta regulator 1 n=1 Tax=Amblyomma americanum TaxID=6943 RepID=A0AAQ4EZF4_AMBAM